VLWRVLSLTLSCGHASVIRKMCHVSHQISRCVYDVSQCYVISSPHETENQIWSWSGCHVWHPYNRLKFEFPIVNVWCSAGFWPLVFSSGRLGASYWGNDSMFGLALLSVSVRRVGLVTLKFQANTHPPLATSAHHIGSSPPAPPTTPLAKKPRTALYKYSVPVSQ
jgi:hypothetical protein